MICAVCFLIPGTTAKQKCRCYKGSRRRRLEHWSSVREAPAWRAAAGYRSYNSSLMHAGNYVHLAPVCYNMLAAFWAASLAHCLVGCHHLVRVRSSWSSDRACQPVCTRPQPILLYYRTTGVWVQAQVFICKIEIFHNAIQRQTGLFIFIRYSCSPVDEPHRFDS